MLIISTFNIKNDSKNYQLQKTKELIKFLIENKIDILSLQELYQTLEADLLRELLKNQYTLHGKYRYKLKILSLINEKTPIITNKNVIENQTLKLPFLPSFLKRIFTRVVIEDENLGKITIINTHLDFQFDITKKRQLKELLKIIEQEENPLILMGDFNLKENNKIFQDFVEKLKKLGIYHAKSSGKTFKRSRGHLAIDHIFYSKDFELVETRIITTVPISDHYPVLIKVLSKKEQSTK